MEEKIDRKYSRGERTSSELALDITQSSHSDTSTEMSLSRTLASELTRFVPLSCGELKLSRKLVETNL